MKSLILSSIVLVGLLTINPFARETSNAGVAKTIKVAVIGGMTMTPLWGELQRQFEADTGLKVEVVATGEKSILCNAMKEGRVDFLTMHSSDATTNLVADGWAGYPPVGKE